MGVLRVVEKFERRLRDMRVIIEPESAQEMDKAVVGLIPSLRGGRRRIADGRIY